MRYREGKDGIGGTGDAGQNADKYLAGAIRDVGTWDISRQRMGVPIQRDRVGTRTDDGEDMITAGPRPVIDRADVDDDWRTDCRKLAQRIGAVKRDRRGGVVVNRLNGEDPHADPPVEAGIADEDRDEAGAVKQRAELVGIDLIEIGHPSVIAVGAVEVDRHFESAERPVSHVREAPDTGITDIG